MTTQHLRVATHTFQWYLCCMGTALQERIKQTTFTSVYQEAFLNLIVVADHLRRNLTRSCEVHGITAAQYNVLRILRGVYPNGHPRCEIIERMIEEAPDVTRLIDRLVRSGHARRAKSKDDGRLSLTFITKKGLDLLDSMQKDVDRADAEFRVRLKESEAKTLSTLCERIYAP